MLLWCFIEDPTCDPQVALHDFSAKMIIYYSLPLELQSKFRDYPQNSFSLWQELHDRITATQEDSLPSSLDDDISKEKSIIVDDLEESCIDLLSSSDSSFLEESSNDISEKEEEASTPEVVH